MRRTPTILALTLVLNQLNASCLKLPLLRNFQNSHPSNWTPTSCKNEPLALFEQSKKILMNIKKTYNKRVILGEPIFL